MGPAKFCTKFLLFVFICKGTIQTVSGYNEFQRACVVAHNILRRAHGSQALVWSEELGDGAQKWCENIALRDELQHDNKTMDSTNQGENLAAITVMDPQRDGPSPNACVLVVGEWYGELKNYNFQTGLAKGPRMPIKHFAQVVWNNTFEIGIGTARSTVHGDIICARYSPRGAEGGPAQFKNNVFADRGDSGNNFTHPLFSKFFNGLTLKQRLNVKNFSLMGGGVTGYTGSLTCGIAKRPSSTVGGKPSNKVVPWIAGLRFDSGNSRGNIFCGGSLVSSGYVLTAAHCVWQKQSPDKQLKVVLGEFDPQNEDGNEMTVGVRKAINHPLFNPETLENDVSLLRLNKEVKFNDNTKPVCLPDSTMNFSAGNLCNVAGFGKIDDGGLLGMTLRTVDVHLMDKTKCGQNYGIISDTKLCTGYNEGMTDFCKEHDGSPLACDNGGKYFLAGVAGSHHNGSACIGPSFPGVYTNVKKLIEWIKQTMDNNN